MGLVEAVRSGFANYAVFRGRAPRAAFWWWVAFVLIAGAVARAIDGALRFSLYTDSSTGAQAGMLAALVNLALLVPGLAVAVRRLHDTGNSGWWLLLAIIPAGLAGALAFRAPSWGPMSTLITVICWAVLIVRLATQGTPGPNRFGPPPVSCATRRILQ